MTRSNEVESSGVYGRTPSKRTITDRFTANYSFQSYQTYDKNLTHEPPGEDSWTHTSSSFFKVNHESSDQSIRQVVTQDGKSSVKQNYSVRDERIVKNDYSTFTNSSPSGSWGATEFGSDTRVFHETVCGDGPAVGFRSISVINQNLNGSSRESKYVGIIGKLNGFSLTKSNGQRGGRWSGFSR